MADIWVYVATEASEAAATRLLDKIEDAAGSLLDFPLAGSPRELLGVGLRVVFQGNYAIYYRPSDTEIVIIRILHGARDAAALAARGGLSSR